MASSHSLLASNDYAPQMFTAIRDKVRRENVCLGCNRGFEDDEHADFLRYVRRPTCAFAREDSR